MLHCLLKNCVNLAVHDRLNDATNACTLYVRVFLYSGDERTVYKCTYIMMCVVVHKPVLEYCM